MKRILLSLFALCIFISCTKRKILVTEIFSIVLETELDVSVVELSLNEGYILFGTDTLKYNRGLLIDNLSEPCPNVVYMPVKNETYVPPEGSYISKKRNYDLDDYRFQNVIYRKIGDRDFKITFPRKDKGITGLFVDSLYKWTISDLYGLAQFNLFGNIKCDNRNQILNSFETIQFHVPKESSEYQKNP